MALIKPKYFIPFTGPDIQKASAPGSFIVAWLGADDVSTFMPVFHPDYSEKSIHVVATGTMSLDILASNVQDGSSPVPLVDSIGAVNFTASGIRFILSNVACIVPSLASASPGLTLDIYMLITTIARRQ